MRNLMWMAVLILGATACNSRASQNAATSDPRIPVKLLAIHENSNRQLIRISGVLGTEEEARLSFKIGGMIESIPVEEGQQIRKGQLLATLKSTEIEAQLKQAELGLEKARRDYERAQHLYHDSVATLEQWQNARTALDLAAQAYQQVRFNEKYSRIYAPGDGFVARKMLHPGEIVGAGAPVLQVNTFSRNSHWVLRAGVAGRDWAAIQSGDSAMVSLDAFPGVAFHAVVIRKAQAADPSSGSFQVELKMSLGNQHPAAGMFGKAVIRTGSHLETCRIPYDALLEADGNQGFVFVSNDQHKVHRVAVNIGQISPDDVYITRGLKGYSYIVVAGSPYLQDGSEIRPVP